MKRIICFLILLTVPCCLWAENYILEKDISSSAKRLTEKYAQGKPGYFKKNMAIAEFAASGIKAEDKNAGQVIGDLFETEFSRSTIFQLVERKNLDKVLTEQSLQLTGATDSQKAAGVGKILNAEVIVYGSITVTGDIYTVTVRMVDVETGAVVSDSFSVSKKGLIESGEYLLDMAYVKKMGVGISVNFLGHTVAGNNAAGYPFHDEENTGITRNIGVEFKYRFTRWFMFGVGADWIYGYAKHYDSMGYDGDDADYLSDAGYPKPFSIEVEGISIPMSLYFVYNPTRRLNLFVQGGADIYVLDVAGYFVPSNGKGFGMNEEGPLAHGETIGFHVYGGVEFFITPRLAVSLKLGYNYAKVDVETGSGNEHLLDLKDTTTLDLGGFTYMPSISFFF